VRRADQLRAMQTSLEPLLPGRLWSGRTPIDGQPESDRCFPSEPDHSLEDHGCRPRSSWLIQQVGFRSVANHLTHRGADLETVPDRIMDEAHATRGDARVLCDLFGLSTAGAYRNTTTVDHPGIAAYVETAADRRNR
jgi:hypothetical protein